jgi:uncharacterized protein (DUF433 family)
MAGLAWRDPGDECRRGDRLHASRDAAQVPQIWAVCRQIQICYPCSEDIGCNLMADLDWSKCPVVESVAGKVGGAWVFKGTRMPVSAIFKNLEAGANIDDILEWYDGLDREQIKAVIEFAARSLERKPQHSSIS